MVAFLLASSRKFFMHACSPPYVSHTPPTLSSFILWPWEYLVAHPIAVGLRALYCWDCVFEPRWGHWLSSVLFVVFWISSGLCDGMIIRSEESYRVCVCLSNFLWFKHFKMRHSRLDFSCCITLKKCLLRGTNNEAAETSRSLASDIKVNNYAALPSLPLYAPGYDAVAPGKTAGRAAHYWILFWCPQKPCRPRLLCECVGTTCWKNRLRRSNRLTRITVVTEKSPNLWRCPRKNGRIMESLSCSCPCSWWSLRFIPL